MKKCIAITGGSRGLGLAFAKGMIQRDWNVSIMARNETHLTSIAKDIGAFAVTGDASKAQDVERFIQDSEKQYGPLDAFVANSGVLGPSGKSWDIHPDEWWEAFEVNSKSMLLASHLMLPRMVERNHGQLILLGSTAGEKRFPYFSAYSTSKAFASKLAENVGKELGEESSVRIYCLNPGVVEDVGMYADHVDLVMPKGSYEELAMNWFRHQKKTGKTVSSTVACDTLVRLLSTTTVMNGAYVV